MKKISVIILVLAIGFGAAAAYTQFETIGDLRYSADAALERLRQASDNPSGANDQQNQADYEYHERTLDKLRDAKAVFVLEAGASVTLAVVAGVLWMWARRTAHRTV